MTVTDRLDAIEARANAATEGAWHEYWPNQCCDGYCVEFGRGGRGIHPNYTELSKADAEFIATSRTDVPQLVAALRAVLKVHEPEAWTSDDLRGHRTTGYRCQECHVWLTDESPDCPTVAAITAALGVSTPPSTVQGTSKLGTNSGRESGEAR